MGAGWPGNFPPNGTAHTPGGAQATWPVGTVAATRLVLRPLANPLSLGYLGLAFATLVLSGTQLHLVLADQSPLRVLAVLVFTVPVQFISSGETWPTKLLDHAANEAGARRQL